MRRALGLAPEICVPLVMDTFFKRKLAWLLLSMRGYSTHKILYASEALWFGRTISGD